MKLSDIAIQIIESKKAACIKVNDVWYHQTHNDAADIIVKQGFKVFRNQGQARYTEGIYFLNHPEGSYGTVTLAAEVKGKFVDFSKDDYLFDWQDFLKDIEWDNYHDLTNKMQDMFKDCVGIVFPSLLVVWYPEKAINKIWIHSRVSVLSNG